MMLLLSVLIGGALGVAAMMLIRVGRLADLDEAIIDLLMKWETRALRAGEESLLIQEFLLDLQSLYGEDEADDRCDD